MNPSRPLIIAVGAACGVYLTLLAFRLDYLSHFLAGAGVALLVLVACSFLTTRLDLAAVGAVVSVGALGWLSEGLWFGDVFFDWIDIVNTVLGALVVAGAVAGATPTDMRRPAMVRLGAGLVVAGFVMRFVLVEMLR